MASMMGIINLNESDGILRELTDHRPLAAVPFAGRYRLIDFVLSNMVNSGIGNVGILVRDKYRSLMDHLRSGKEWDLDRKREGLYILPPALPQSCDPNQGDLECFRAHLDYLQQSRQEYVVISGGSVVCNINYNKVLAAHLDKKADVTVVYKQLRPDADDYSRGILIHTDDDGRVVELEINPLHIRTPKLSLEICIISRKLLMELVDSCVSRGGRDLMRDGLMKNFDRLRIYGYEYEGYFGRIHSVQSYYRHSMELLMPAILRELFFSNGLIYTKVKDEAPAKYKENAAVQNSLVANGCVIEGRVENSIIFRAVKVRKGAWVKNSIIMQKSEVGEDVVLDNVICDKNVTFTKGANIRGEKKYLTVIAKGTVI